VRPELEHGYTGLQSHQIKQTNLHLLLGHAVLCHGLSLVSKGVIHQSSSSLVCPSTCSLENRLHYKEGLPAPGLVIAPFPRL
jgi:hypothetical protein